MDGRIVFPAPAGVILSVGYIGIAEVSFPRTCGGDPIINRYFYGVCLFSPHLRG